MANEERGEVDIILDGGTYVMAPTFQAMAEIEAGSGQKFVPFARGFMLGNIGIVDVAVVITAAIKAGGKPAVLKDVGEMVVRTGLMSPGLLEAVKTFLDNAMSGGVKPKEGAAREGGPGK